MNQVSCPAIPCWVLREYLFDQKEHHGEFEAATLIGFLAYPGEVPTLKVLLESGAVFDYLPVMAVWFGDDPSQMTEPPAGLCSHNCPSHTMTFQQIDYLAGKTVSCWIGPTKEPNEGIHVGVLDFPLDNHSVNVVLLSSGWLCLIPNYRMSFTSTLPTGYLKIHQTWRA